MTRTVWTLLIVELVNKLLALGQRGRAVQTKVRVLLLIAEHAQKVERLRVVGDNDDLVVGRAAHFAQDAHR